MGKSIFDESMTAIGVVVAVIFALTLFFVMSPPFGLVMFVLVFFCFSGLLAEEFHKIAKTKGYSQGRYYWIPFFFGPLGYLLVIALPFNPSATQQYDEIADALPKL